MWIAVKPLVARGRKLKGSELGWVLSTKPCCPICEHGRVSQLHTYEEVYAEGSKHAKYWTDECRCDYCGTEFVFEQGFARGFIVGVENPNGVKLI